MGFQTAGGKSVHISEAARAKAAALLASPGSEQAPPPPTESNAPPRFSTARGNVVAISSDARAKMAEDLFGGDDDVSDALPAANVGEPRAAPRGFAPPRGPLGKRAFQTAAGEVVGGTGGEPPAAFASSSRQPLAAQTPQGSSSRLTGGVGGKALATTRPRPAAAAPAPSKPGFKPPRKSLGVAGTPAAAGMGATSRRSSCGSLMTGQGPKRFVAPRTRTPVPSNAAASAADDAAAVLLPRSAQASATRWRCTCLAVTPFHSRSCPCCCAACGGSLEAPGDFALHALGCRNGG
jgi:hypothetical protein